MCLALQAARVLFMDDRLCHEYCPFRVHQVTPVVYCLLFFDLDTRQSFEQKGELCMHASGCVPVWIRL